MNRCPRCNRPRYYSTERSMIRASNENRNCPSCNTTLSNRTKYNHVGERFGTIVVTNQYYQKSGNLKVDYVCDCGTHTIAKSYSKVKIQKMCLKCRKTNSHRINTATSFNMVFREYVRSAKLRGLCFNLTKEQIFGLTQQSCFYCGAEPSNVMRPSAKGGSYVYNGIDRKDSNMGYIMENVVSCCKKCNNAKWDLSTADFLNHIKKVYSHNFVEHK